MVLTVARYTSATASRKLRKNKTYYSQILEGRDTPRATQQGGVGGEKGRLGFFLYWVQVWVPRVLQVHSLLVNLKHKRGIKVQKGKQGHPSGQLSRSPRAF